MFQGGNKGSTVMYSVYIYDICYICFCPANSECDSKSELNLSRRDKLLMVVDTRCLFLRGRGVQGIIGMHISGKSAGMFK